MRELLESVDAIRGEARQGPRPDHPWSGTLYPQVLGARLLDRLTLKAVTW